MIGRMITFSPTLKKRLSFANVMSCVAVLLAASGSAYAASVVTGSSVKDGSLTGRDIRDRSIELRDLSGPARTSLRGQQGIHGVNGVAGIDGSNGAPVITDGQWSQHDPGRAGRPVPYPLTAGTTWTKLTNLETDMLAPTVFFTAPATCSGSGAALRIYVDGNLAATVALPLPGTGSSNLTEIAKSAFAGVAGSHTISATLVNTCGVGEDYSVSALYVRVIRLI